MGHFGFLLYTFLYSKTEKRGKTEREGGREGSREGGKQTPPVNVLLKAQ